MNANDRSQARKPKEGENGGLEKKDLRNGNKQGLTLSCHVNHNLFMGRLLLEVQAGCSGATLREHENKKEREKKRRHNSSLEKDPTFNSSNAKKKSK
jgi:hypothetical protein